jgi:protein-tyrosine phosphatase
LIDLHSHVLPGLDDGARDLEDAVAIARSMTEDGVTVVAATPHVRDDYPTTPELMEAGVAELRDTLRAAGIALDVRPGAEIAHDRLDMLDDESRARFGLGGNPRLLLIEFPYVGWPAGIADRCAGLLRAGVIPVLAHPERNPSVQARPADLDGLVRLGALVQVTAASVDGRIGRASATCAFRLVELGLVHLLATDAHGPGVREAGLSSAIEALGDPALGAWLTNDAPAMLLAGERPPPPPPSRPRRGLRRLLSGR